MNEDNYVYVGTKPTMKYVLAAVAQLNGGNSIVVIKARGRAISKAVDVALILQDRFVQNGEMEDIVIRTEALNGEDGQPTKVSSIEITLFKPSEIAASGE
jgi:DNA-binding protein